MSTQFADPMRGNGVDPASESSTIIIYLTRRDKRELYSFIIKRQEPMTHNIDNQCKSNKL
jgi:hypothetical protein